MVRSTCSAGQAGESQDSAGFDQRGVRRSQRPSSNRGILGQRQPDRHVPVTTRASAARRPCSSTITGSIGCASKSPASSTPMVAHAPMTDASCRRLRHQALRSADHLVRRRKSKLARSAMSRTWSTAWSG
jgi:hypothetical protein